jgi:excisionase family DNA binding protein
MSKRIQQHHSVMPIAQLLTISQVADLLCIHRTAVYDFIKNDGLPVMKLGTLLNPRGLEQASAVDE